MLIAINITLLTAEGACSHGCVGGCLRLGSMILKVRAMAQSDARWGVTIREKIRNVVLRQSGITQQHPAGDRPSHLMD
ncbi:MAG TPA: hypothetical protein VEI99_06835 [Terriglobales bacterium]|nr:hypothetical protein [Terriglobales bacterium]